MKNHKKQYFRTLLKGFHEIIVFWFRESSLLFSPKNKQQQLLFFCVKNQKTQVLVVFDFLWKNKKLHLLFFGCEKTQNTFRKQTQTIISWNPSRIVRAFLQVLFFFIVLFLFSWRLFKVSARKTKNNFSFFFVFWSLGK